MSEKTWPCEHIVKRNDDGPNDGRWYVISKIRAWQHRVPDNWDKCPVKNCGAVRPEEPNT